MFFFKFRYVDAIIFRNYSDGVVVSFSYMNTKKIVRYECYLTWALHLGTHVNKGETL